MTRVGIVSDAHINSDEPDTALAFKRVLEAFQTAGVDCVVIVGDATNNGRSSEYEMLKDVAGTPAFPMYWVMGNHEYGHDVLSEVELAAKRILFNSIAKTEVAEQLVYNYHLTDKISIVTINPEKAFTDFKNVDFLKGITYTGYSEKAYAALYKELSQNTERGVTLQLVISHYPIDHKMSNLKECDLLPDGSFQDLRMRNVLQAAAGAIFISGHAHGDGRQNSTPELVYDEDFHFYKLHAGALYKDMQYLIMDIMEDKLIYHMETLDEQPFEMVEYKITG